MDDPPSVQNGATGSSRRRQIDAQIARKLNGRRTTNQTVWFGLGMMGTIGWSVTVPTLLGAALGAWLDRHHPGRHSWTLALLSLGLSLGCWSAWRWVDKEGNEMRKHFGDQDG